jgi:hypothetical protein
MQKKLKIAPKEKFLFHGCRVDTWAESIKLKGFEIKMAKPGRYGTGLYFAIKSNYSTNGYDCKN